MNAAQHILIFGVRCYRYVLSPAKDLVFGPLGRCRFTPSCSEYALDAVRHHGSFAGSWLAMKRIARCHPWGGCGHDPVPERKSEVRGPKSENRTPKAEKPSRPAPAASDEFGFRASAFLRTSDFGLRISDAGAQPHPKLH